MYLFEWLFWTAIGFLVYGFVVYPMMMFIAGMFLPNRRPEIPGELPSVALLFAAYNEDAVIRRKLENALQLDYPRDKLQILIGSDQSSDQTNQIAREFQTRGVQLFDFQERRGKPSVLNDLVSKIQSDVLFLCDANVFFDSQALKRLVCHLENPGVGAVTGDVRLQSHESDFGTGESTYYGVERTIQLGESNLGSVMGVDGGMYVVRKSLFTPFPPSSLNEEFILSMHVIQKGFRIKYEPTAIATETATPVFSQEFRRRVRISSGAIQALRDGMWPPISRPIELWQFVSHKLIRWLNPVWLVLAFVFGLALAKTWWPYTVSAFAQILFYSLAFLGNSSLHFRKTRVGGISFYFTMSHIAMAIGLVKGIFSSPQVTWAQVDRVVKD